jgi:glutamyl-tRNA synthetase
MSRPTVRTRFAPSPTGRLHLGNVRTALFNFLAARRAGGQFVVRCEDTDTDRSEERWLEAALAELAWLGMDWEEGPDVGGDHGPYRQSERAEHYAKALETLKAEGAAYPCFRTDEELAAHRRRQVAAGRPPRFDREWARLDAAEVRRRESGGQAPVWRFRVPSGRSIEWLDLVRGPQRMASREIGDFVLVRSDGVPGFLFGNAVDDALMGITDVLRGEDHTSNTPRQLLILEALGLPAPRYGHLSLVVTPEGQPLSKRAGSPGLEDLRGAGYLPAAVANDLARLGHGIDGDDLMDMTALAAAFDIERLSTSPARFDLHQLDHWQHKAVAAQDTRALAAWAGSGLASVPPDRQTAFLDLVRHNVHTPSDVAAWARCLFEADGVVPGREMQAAATEAGPVFFATAAATVGEGLGAMSKAVREASGRKGRALFLPLRLALTGRTDGPELGPLLELMPRSLAQARLQRWADAAGADPQE